MEQQDQSNRQQQPQNSQVFKVRGMKTDFSESSFNNSFAFENKNMRINIVDDDNTLLNLTNERGTKELCEFEGIAVGLKKYSSNKILLVTTTNEGGACIDSAKENNGISIDSLLEEDGIELPEFKDTLYVIDSRSSDVNLHKVKSFSNTDTGLSAHDPIEIEHFSDGDKDMFYIADGVNNFKAFGLIDNKLIANNDKLEYNNDCITGKELIDVSQSYSSSGEFFAGVMVYCFAYINKLGHKTGIIDVSDLVYLTNYSKEGEIKGLAPNARCNISNVINISNLSTGFEYVEVYSLYRASLDGEIVCKLVGKTSVSESVVLTDLNKGVSISYQEIMGRLNSVIIPSTLTQKNSSLFMGNIRLNNYSGLKRLIGSAGESASFVTDGDIFLKNNMYFYGIQLQDGYGNWSPVISIGSNHGNTKTITIDSAFVSNAVSLGYVSARAMILDNKRIRNTVCEGISTPALSIDNGKYGIDYYSPYFYNPKKPSDNKYFGFGNDIYNYDGKQRIKISESYADLYSPDVEFNENLVINKDDTFTIYRNSISYETLQSHNIDVEISGNTGTLFNAIDSDNLGKATIVDWNALSGSNYYCWNDSITGYQKALQILFAHKEYEDNYDDIFMSLYNMNQDYPMIHERPSKYVIYTWQPSGSLNDSNGTTSVLKAKRISRKYVVETSELTESDKNGYTKCFMFDGTVSNIPLGKENVYCGSVNQKMYPSSWGIDRGKYCLNIINDEQLWDDDQISQCDGYSLATLQTYNFVGQPIEIYRGIDNSIRPLWKYSALGKIFNDRIRVKHSGKSGNICYMSFFRGGKHNSTLKSIGFNIYGNDSLNYYTEKIYDKRNRGYTRMDFILSMEELPECEDSPYGKHDYLRFPVKVRVTNNFNRSGCINMAYNTARHIVIGNNVADNMHCMIVKQPNDEYISNIDIETGQWIICSRKNVLVSGSDCVFSVDINEKYVWDEYEVLKTEPHSMNDENQVTCCIGIKGISSYINPLCRYDNLRDLNDYNGVTSSVFNKMNIVYNQKNNFFAFMGITDDTSTDDIQESTILYSGTKLQNEQEDTYCNLSISDFYTIDSNITRINKLINYNDKLLCLSDNAIVNILYNENVVINTDSIQSLGLASSDKISGVQLITNTYGCLNKWSIGIYNNVLYFNDDLNNKIMSFSDGFSILNESLGIETLNGRILKNNVWNPADFCNTKLNIDKYSKDIHYTSSDIDISLNTAIGEFMSLFSYENVSYMETVGNHSIAIRDNRIYSLREGDYNYFFGKYEPYWTTVILNNNSIMNKVMNNVEFNTEAYTGNIPDHDFTFDTVSVWNDYQSNRISVDYKMYGLSSLKKKFRVWRVNMLRNNSRIVRRDYDMVANTWTYLKLSCETENTDKLTLHWINVNYR